MESRIVWAIGVRVLSPEDCWVVVLVDDDVVTSFDWDGDRPEADFVDPDVDAELLLIFVCFRKSYLIFFVFKF